MTDVALFHAPDGGNIESINGVVTMDDTLATAVYLSLFGGNEQDSGSDGDKPREWWGNKEEPDASARYRSETQYLLNTLPLVPASLKRFQDGANRDLAWLQDEELATFIAVTARMPGMNTVALDIAIEVNGVKFGNTFSWSSKK